MARPGTVGFVRPPMADNNLNDLIEKVDLDPSLITPSGDITGTFPNNLQDTLGRNYYKLSLIGGW